MISNQTSAGAERRAGGTPWLSREGKFRFELGLRQGDAAFFGVSPDGGKILAQRKSVLHAHPARHAAMPEEGASLLEETCAVARSSAGVRLPQAASLHEECVALGERWEPEFLLLKPDPDGVHRLMGGCVCFPSSWDLREKLGLPVEAIHAPVPTVNANLGTQISAFLRRIKPGAIWERWNWGLAAVDAWNHHPELRLPRLNADSTLTDSWLRIEHQAFRSLDSEGSLLFAIRLTVVPLLKIAAQPEAALRLAELLETMPDEIAAYKGLSSARLPLASQLRSPRLENALTV